VRRGWPLLVVALVAAVYAVAIASTGGFDLQIASARIRSHAWERPALVGSFTFILFLWVERRRTHDGLLVWWTRLESPTAARAIVLAAVTWTLFAGVRFGSPVAGGSDSYGYLSQAHQLAEGRLSEEIPNNPAFTWTNARWTLTPLAHVGTPQPGRMAATYPPGLPLLMAAVVPLGDRAAYLVVPVFGALLVLVTWRVGLLLGDSLAGSIAALLLSLSPTFMLQAIQPMSDVPAAACWAAALLAAVGETRRSALLAGALTSLAVLIRPNLAPLAAIVLLLITAQRQARGQRVAIFLAPVVIGTGVLLMIQAARYGSPFGSGYGDTSLLFARANIPVNWHLYSRWITSSHTPLIWLCVAAPLVLRRARASALFWAVAATIVSTWCAYLPYVAFRPDEWFYTRFLLPAIPFMLLFACMVVLAGIRLFPEPARLVLVSGFVLCMGLEFARSSAPILRGTAAHELRYKGAGTFVRDALPANAIVLAAQHSGSVRYYSNKPTVRWDIAAPTDLDAIITAVRAAGFAPFAVMDEGEVATFREHFPGQRTVDRLRPLGEFGVARVYSVE
jgi:hypothetical protein